MVEWVERLERRRKISKSHTVRTGESQTQESTTKFALLFSIKIPDRAV